MTGGMGTFARWQSRYAEHGIATFPVSESKKPLIKNWQRVGRKGSAELAGKFADESALAFVCGKPSGVTIVDIDTDDEQGVKEAFKVFGSSPLIYRTGGGHFAIAYRYNGERRRIRPIKDLPIDILGHGGFAIVPPSVTSGVYHLKGELADLDRLPIARIDRIEPDHHDVIPKGKRNDTLFRFALSAAPYADDLTRTRRDPHPQLGL